MISSTVTVARGAEGFLVSGAFGGTQPPLAT
jgi:hypothetical protein